MMVVLREPPVLRQLPIQVYESDIKIQNFCSSEIAQVSLWSSQNPRMNSLFASKAYMYRILSLKNLTVCLHYHSPSSPWSGSNGDEKIWWLKVKDSYKCRCFFVRYQQLFHRLERNVYSFLLLLFFPAIIPDFQLDILNSQGRGKLRVQQAES